MAVLGHNSGRDALGGNVPPVTMRRGALITLFLALALAAPTAAQAGYEVNVSKGSPGNDGEPSLDVNPTDRSNLVMGYMTVNRGQCSVAASFDRGKTWQNQVLGNLTDPFYSFCADPTLAFGPDGTVYLAVIAFNQTFQAAHTVVTRSRDGGEHWSQPVEAVGGSTPPLDGFDRPWLAVDKKTGTVYLTTMTIFSRPMGPLAHRYLLSSRDQGKTWSEASIVDSPQYPADHWATGTITIGPRGRVAVAYAARAVPDSGMSCPCVVLATTTDGVHFKHRPVPFADTMFGIKVPEQGPLSALRLIPGPVVGADPTRPGRYAVAIASWKGLVPFVAGQAGIGEGSPVQAQLFLTNDSGRSWRGPAVLGEDPSKDRDHIWLAYSPRGALGVTWRTHAESCCFGSRDVWSVVSRDGGRKFDRPRRLSHAPSPQTGTFPFGLGDDFQSVVLDRSFLHAAWAAERSGGEDAYYGRLRLRRGR